MLHHQCQLCFVNATFVLKEKILTSYLIPETILFDPAGLDLLTFRILKPFASKNIAVDRSTF